MDNMKADRCSIRHDAHRHMQPMRISFTHFAGLTSLTRLLWNRQYVLIYLFLLLMSLKLGTSDARYKHLGRRIYRSFRYTTGVGMAFRQLHWIVALLVNDLSCTWVLLIGPRTHRIVKLWMEFSHYWTAGPRAVVQRPILARHKSTTGHSCPDDIICKRARPWWNADTFRLMALCPIHARAAGSKTEYT